MERLAFVCPANLLVEGGQKCSLKVDGIRFDHVRGCVLDSIPVRFEKFAVFLNALESQTVSRTVANGCV